MILATLLDQIQEPKPVSGIVRAFAVYMDPECRPEDRAATVYVARRFYDDGSTVTLLRTVRDNVDSIELRAQGDATIARDPQGKATRIESHLDAQVGTHSDSRAISIGYSAKASWKMNPEGLLTGSLATDLPGTWPNVPLPDRALYVVDPLEAVAFGSPGGGEWLIPPSFIGVPKSPLVFPTAVRFRVMPGVPRAVPFRGRNEACLVHPILREWIGTGSRPPAREAGTLIYGYDGALVAYVPNYVFENYASRTWPFGYKKTTPMSQTMRVPGAVVGYYDGIYVPVPTSPGTRKEILGF